MQGRKTVNGKMSPAGKRPARQKSVAVGPMEYAERLRFETLLSDLSARFIHLPADRVDDAIEDAQCRICECLEIDGATLWRLDAEHPDTLLLTHSHMPPGTPPLPKAMDANETFPWCLASVRRRETLVLPRVADTPAAALRDQELWRHYGVRSALIIPLSAGGGPVFGAATFVSIREERAWSSDLVGRLSLVAQVFANALARQRFDQALRENEERLSLATEAAGAGTWLLDARASRFWVGTKVMEMLGLPPGEVLDVEAFFGLIHPEDRSSMRNIMAKAMNSPEMMFIEYRILRPDGQLRWLHSRGRMYARRAGAPARLTGITSDVTERKLREESLRASEARVAAAMDVAGLGFYETDAEGRTQFLDDRIRALLDVPPGDAVDGRAYLLEHVHPEDQARLQEISRKIQGGGIDRIAADYRYLHPVRGLLWLRHLAEVVGRDANRRALRTVGVIGDITERKLAEESLRQALAEVQALRDRLELENVVLREQLRRDDGRDDLVGESEAVLRMLAQAKKVAPTDSAVLIQGETGTGKELLAQAIHDLSRRRAKPMVKVNCAALPAPLIEGELFGREKGAYTGAMTRQMGRFEVADGSTIFLDEIGDLPLELQVKLLRVLQDGRFERLGSHATLKTDVRVIAATNRDLAAMVRDGRFRADLFHRLNVFPIEVPPLRSRVADIPLLVWTFLQEFNQKMGKAIDAVPKPVMERLKQYAWPGNVRELRNLIERAVIVSEGATLQIELPASGQGAQARPGPLEEVERKHIADVLARTHWRISGKGGAAEILGLVPTTLHSRMKKLGIVRPT